jgi:hypothetical protein
VVLDEDREHVISDELSAFSLQGGGSDEDSEHAISEEMSAFSLQGGGSRRKQRTRNFRSDVSHSSADQRMYILTG